MSNSTGSVLAFPIRRAARLMDALWSTSARLCRECSGSSTTARSGRTCRAKSTVHRWFRTWVDAGVSEKILESAAHVVEKRGEYLLYEYFIDGTFSKATGGDGIGCTKVGKGVRIMVLVDVRGLPVA